MDRATEMPAKDAEWKNPNTVNKENIGLKDALKNLDNALIFDVYNQSKVTIIGVLCGIKPICTIKGFSYLENAKQVVTIVEQLGLKTNVDRWNNAGQYDVWVARDEETLQKYQECEKTFESGDNTKGQLEIGKLYGYPESSSPAFLNKELRLDERKRQLIEYKDIAAYSTFCHFVLSKDNYKEEINQYGRKLMLATKEYLPNTFKKIVKEWRIEKISNAFQSIKNSFSKK